MGPMRTSQPTAREDNSNTGRDGSRAGCSSRKMVVPGLISGEVATPACTWLSQQVWCVLQRAATHFCNRVALRTLMYLGSIRSLDGLTEQLSLAWQRLARPQEEEGVHSGPVRGFPHQGGASRCLSQGLAHSARVPSPGGACPSLSRLQTHLSPSTAASSL